jgi:hypothetical protein
MGATERITRICPVKQLKPELLRAIKEYARKRKLGDPGSEAVLCCETVTERKGRSRLAAWLSESPDAVDHLGIILTGSHLLWARHGERSGTVAMDADLRELNARPYKSRLSKESGLEIYGLIGEKKKRLGGKLALGPQEDARKFVAEVVRAVEEANPTPKKRDIPWLRWLSRRNDDRSR